MIRFSLTVGLAAALTLALAPAAADAQSRGRQARPAPPADPAETLAAAQAAATAAGLACVANGANRLGTTGGNAAFEVSCETGPGFIVIASETPQAFNCLGLAQSATEENATRCTLPANADAMAAIRPFAQAANVACEVDQAGWVGQLPSGEDRYEVGCAGTEGYWIDVPKNALTPTNVLPCLEVVGARRCEFTTADEQVAWLQTKYASATPAGCTPAEVRVAGQNDQAKFYEVRCESGSGFFYRTLVADGAFDRAIPCAEATAIGGGCTLVDASAAVAAAADRRQTALAALAPSCQPGDTRLIGRETSGDQREVVEFSCQGKPIGVVAFIGANADANEALDCVTVTLRSINCQMTSAQQIRAAVQSQMDAGNMPCPIRQLVVHARTDDLNGDFIEVKCQDDRGLFGQFPHDRTKPAADVMICARARLLYGFECEL